MMKKVCLLSIAMSLFALASFAGGLLTNSNQSAQFVRMLSRNASTQIDAVYYNPAGLIKLENGWHFAIHNQSIFQEKTVNSGFPLLNDGEYVGDVKAPVFPSAFAVYKINDLAFSLGFGPNGGGGSATFERGLPSFEIPLSKLKSGQLSPIGVTGYDADLYFDGSSIFWGIQLGVTYKLNEILSVYGGGRYLPSSNTYAGSITNIRVNTNNGYVNASQYLTQFGNYLKDSAAGLSSAANNMQQLVTLGAGSLTLAQVQTMGYISSTDKALFERALLDLGLTESQVAAMNVTQVQGTFNTYAAGFTVQGNTLIETGNGLQDKNVEAKQTGAGITPIVGLNFSPSDKLNVAVRYEHKTSLKLTNSTEVDDLGLFPDGQETSSDIPGILAIGVGFNPIPLLETQLSYTLYFDKGVNWGRNVRELVYKRNVAREIDKNYWELALGLQFNLSERFALSLGGMTSNPGVADNYQSDFSYTNPSMTAAFGFEWKLTDRLNLDAGFMNTFYKDAEVTYTDPDLTDNGGKYNEVFGKTTFGFGFGLSYSIFQ